MHIIIPIIIGLTVPFISYKMYMDKGMFKQFYHDILGWHLPEKNSIPSYDGCNYCAICKYCGKNIILDSQGNWFEK